MFNQLFSFEGRIRRREYAVSLITFIFACINVIVLDSSPGGGDRSIIILCGFPLLWFISAQGTKRCHDIDSSGWWQLMPFFFIWLIIEDGQDGANQYGENLKGIENSTEQTILDLNYRADEEPSLKISKKRIEEIGEGKQLNLNDGFGKIEDGMADCETEIKTTKEKTEEIRKNKWLHPTDGFGKMEEGLADGRRLR